MHCRSVNNKALRRLFQLDPPHALVMKNHVLRHTYELESGGEV